MLDCLDGMHARNTKQCSRFGEFLDHWADSVHTPMFAAACALAFDADGWIFVMMHIPAIFTYNAQLIHFHHTRVFIHTAGVETQIFVTCVFFCTAFSIPYYDGLKQYQSYVLLLLAVASIIVGVIVQAGYYMRYSDQAMFINHLKTISVQGLLGFMFLNGMINRMGYSLMSVLFGWRINGSYVLYSLSKKHYSGFDVSLLYWCFAIMYSYQFTRPIDLEDMLWADFVPWVGHIPITSHNILPYLCFLEVGYRNFREAWAMKWVLKD